MCGQVLCGSPAYRVLIAFKFAAEIMSERSDRAVTVVADENNPRVVSLFQDVSESIVIKRAQNDSVDFFIDKLFDGSLSFFKLEVCLYHSGQDCGQGRAARAGIIVSVVDGLNGGIFQFALDAEFDAPEDLVIHIDCHHPDAEPSSLLVDTSPADRGRIAVYTH